MQSNRPLRSANGCCERSSFRPFASSTGSTTSGCVSCASGAVSALLTLP